MLKFETKLEREAWIKFASGASAYGRNIENACHCADMFLIEMRKREESLNQNTVKNGANKNVYGS